jgi:hypothetical protein
MQPGAGEHEGGNHDLGDDVEVEAGDQAKQPQPDHPVEEGDGAGAEEREEQQRVVSGACRGSRWAGHRRAPSYLMTEWRPSSRLPAMGRKPFGQLFAMACAVSLGLAALAGQAPRRHANSRRHQSRWVAAPDAAADAAVHAGCLHRVRHPRAGQRVVSRPLPPRGDARRGHRAGEHHARWQRGVGHRGLGPAHRQADAVHLRAGSEGPRDARHPREAADPGARGRRRPRAHLQDRQGSAHLPGARRRHRLGTEPQRLPSRRAPAHDQDAHLRIAGTLTDPGCSLQGGRLEFSRTIKGLRNTVLLPAGWGRRPCRSRAASGRPTAASSWRSSTSTPRTRTSCASRRSRQPARADALLALRACEVFRPARAGVRNGVDPGAKHSHSSGYGEHLQRRAAPFRAHERAWRDISQALRP